MNLGDYRTRLQDFYGTQLSTDTDFLNRVINDSYMELASLADWWWLETSEILRFEGVVTAIALTATKGTADLVPATAMDTVYQHGWLATGDHTYRIDTSTGTALTIDADWIEDSGTYTAYVWNDMVTLSSDCDRPIALLCRNDPNHIPVRLVDSLEIEAIGPDLSNHEREFAYMYSVLRDPPHFSSNMVLRIYPPPDEVVEYVFRYKQVPDTMANDTARTLIPDKHERCLVQFAMLKLARIVREDPDIINSLEIEYQRAYLRMVRDQSRNGRIQRRAGRRSLNMGLYRGQIIMNIEGT